MSLRRISQLEHELGLTLPCSDPACGDCHGIGKIMRTAWDTRISLALMSKNTVYDLATPPPRETPP